LDKRSRPAVLGFDGAFQLSRFNFSHADAELTASCDPERRAETALWPSIYVG
jgi:hypothetical protein